DADGTVVTATGEPLAVGTHGDVRDHAAMANGFDGPAVDTGELRRAGNEGAGAQRRAGGNVGRLRGVFHLGGRFPADADGAAASLLQDELRRVELEVVLAARQRDTKTARFQLQLITL